MKSLQMDGRTDAKKHNITSRFSNGRIKMTIYGSFFLHNLYILFGYNTVV